MGRTRFNSYRRRRIWLVIAKLFAIFYIVTFTGAYLFSDTGAYFTDQVTDKETIMAGEWWDQSDLVFIGEHTQNVKVCPPVEITVDIKNNGHSMTGPTKYEVYYVENGNPKKQGIKITEDMIDSMKEEESGNLSFHAKKTGSYMFKALQRQGYNGDEDNRHAIWSEKVMVKCIGNDQKKTNDTADESGASSNQSVSDTPSSENKQNTKSVDKANDKADMIESGTNKAGEKEDITKENGGTRAAGDPDKPESKSEEDNAEDEDKGDEMDE